MIADLAHAADSLTLARLGFALLLVGAVATDRLALAAWLLAAAWVSDALDGRVARASMRATRLGHLDLAVDTAVGAGVLIGMGFGGHLPVVLAIGAVVALGGGFLVLRNAALAFALQAMAYAWFMIVLWLKHPSAWWVPPATVAVLLVVGYRRLITMLVPAFLGGMAALVRRRRGRGSRARPRTGQRAAGTLTGRTANAALAGHLRADDWTTCSASCHAMRSRTCPSTDM